MTKIYAPFRHNSIFEGWDLPFVDNIDDCDVVVLWNDLNYWERQTIKLARSLGKKVVVMQHGRKGSSKYFPPFNEKIQADRLLVWGDFDKRSLIGAGQDPARIRVVGTTVLHGLPHKREHSGINVVFCPEHWDREVEENNWVKEALRKLEGVNIITKIIEAHDPKDYDNPIQSHRDTPEHLEICKEVLATADVVVGVSESTFELMAQCMDIPVVIMEEWTPKTFGGDERYFTYRRVISDAAMKADRSTLLGDIKYCIDHPEFLSKERMRVAVDEGGIHLPTKELIRRELASL